MFLFFPDSPIRICWDSGNLLRNLLHILYGDPLRAIPGGFTVGAEKEMGSRRVRADGIRILLPIATGEFEMNIGPRTSS